jgi:1-deoxy-D-xylulose-5-phosphate reductoisomerase
MKNLVLLGATGSIGTQTLDVCRSLPDTLRPIGLSAHAQWQTLCSLAKPFSPRWIAITDESLRERVDIGAVPSGTELLWGESGIERMVRDPATDTVVAAMVGAAGLRGTMAALDAGKNVALANKETLVVGGPMVTELARVRSATLLPIDSEHSAILQCLQNGRSSEVARVILTASGGPFRTRPFETFESITVAQALEHPTWNMGKKITVDSATMMNKALEIIETHWLFGVSADQIAVVIHPQSMIHSMVEYCDGSVIAQASPPDMRLPIQYALTYPDRLTCPNRKIELDGLGSWTFERPDPRKFPALGLGYEVVRRAGTSGAALNAANEIAVERFLAEDIRFVDIVPMVADVLRTHPYEASPTIDDLWSTDRWAREEARRWTRSV